MSASPKHINVHVVCVLWYDSWMGKLQMDSIVDHMDRIVDQLSKNPRHSFINHIRYC